MQYRRGLVIALALALSGVLPLAGNSWAQNRGDSGPGSQLCIVGPGGTCVAPPPPQNPGNQTGPGYGPGQGQQQEGPKGPRAGRQNQPHTPANPPASGR